MTLPVDVDATPNYTAAEHATHHNDLHAEFNTPTHTHSGSSVPTPDDIPASPHADDYEFNGSTSTLPTGWSWVNQGTATYEEDYGGGTVMFPSTASTAIRGIVRNVPAGSSWTVTTKVLQAKMSTSNSGPWTGLFLYETSSGKIVSFNFNQDGGAFAVDKYTNTTTYAGSSFTAAFPLKPPLSPLHHYFRIRKNSATSWDFQVSRDRKAWAPIAAAADVSSFMTPDQIGVYVDGESSSAGAAEIQWYRVT